MGCWRSSEQGGQMLSKKQMIPLGAEARTRDHLLETHLLYFSVPQGSSPGLICDYLQCLSVALFKTVLWISMKLIFRKSTVARKL